MRLQTRLWIAKVLMLVCFVSAYLLASNMDYQDQKQSEKQYCDDIKDGVYPDYKDLKQYCEVTYGSK